MNVKSADYGYNNKSSFKFWCENTILVWEMWNSIYILSVDSTFFFFWTNYILRLLDRVQEKLNLLLMAEGYWTLFIHWSIVAMWFVFHGFYSAKLSALVPESHVFLRNTRLSRRMNSYLKISFLSRTICMLSFPPAEFKLWHRVAFHILK